MREQRVYDLKGLKWIFAGLIIGMVAGAFMGVVANQTMSKELGSLSSILNAAGIILLIVSLVLVIKGLENVINTHLILEMPESITSYRWLPMWR